MALDHDATIYLGRLRIRQLIPMPLAGANRLGFTFQWEHVVVHANHHGNEDHRIIEEMEFHPREHKLQNACRHRGVKKIVMDSRLSNQQGMFNVMPELDIQSNRPPLERSTCESFAQRPNPDQHDDRETIVKGFCLDQPWVK